MTLRPEIQALLDDLLRDSASTMEISVDHIGERMGTATVDEIEAVVSGLEMAGRSIVTGLDADPKADLRTVVEAVHTLRARGDNPTVRLLASVTGMSEERVRTALRLGQIFGR